MKNRRASWILSIVLILLMAVPATANDGAKYQSGSSECTGATGAVLSSERIEAASSDDHEKKNDDAADTERTSANDYAESENGRSENTSSGEQGNNDSANTSSDSTSFGERVSSDGASTENASSDEVSGENSAQNDMATEDQNTISDNQETLDAEPEEPITMQAETLTFVIIGKGKVDLNNDGDVTCAPAAGYEVQSITADKVAVIDSEEASGKNADKTASGDANTVNYGKDIVKNVTGKNVSIKAGDQIPEDEIEDVEFSDETTITFVFVREETDDVDLSIPASATAVFG